MRLAVLQMTASDDPAANLEVLARAAAEAAEAGADMLLTPEVSNCLSASRERQRAVLRPEPRDPTLAAMRAAAAEHGLWVLLGSLALRTADPAGRFANRSVLIDADGAVAARYDKIHMFDVAVSEAETYRESAAYRPGARATVARTPWAGLGLTVCYDLRFPALYRRLAQAGAEVLSVPSAFSPETGRAHWETLLRALAIETGCFVVAPAQTGTHPASEGRARRTHGHSLVVGPWGDVRLDAGVEPGLHLVEIDPAEVAEARARVPSLTADRAWEGP